MVKKEDVCAHIEEIGILPAIRVSSAEEALFAAEQMFKWGINVVELTMTVPGAIQVIADLVRTRPKLLVGAGTVLDPETARACIDAGATFVTSPGINLKIVEFAVRHNVAAIPGALTPTEVMMAHDAGADMIKIFPCAAVGGPSYIKALKAPFPHVPLIASGGVDQVTAGEFIRAGAVALGIGSKLIPPEAVERRDQNWIHELTGRFLSIVQRARTEV
ncbi:MAG TPA: bifunctional 4-hydroxy-2-oxoglutarate aldolase/2-dehydro-3-deoxy-phosphogluconate aldolase [Bryobacteraceae bacterium]|jgi:2-dehydro-3-deoxyphosphogluconate aldolase/(4S)-4-hydroxy-2-oxoglutarate aldolase|nr:bifunctional 4-hydroxy-2-oxoglutarate aldolase/2-dehydro-3-deoxy-phosphogluconate aldolase [Bryobacteraceae bacterium]